VHEDVPQGRYRNGVVDAQPVLARDRDRRVQRALR
jgi:hypothetical protein